MVTVRLIAFALLTVAAIDDLIYRLTQRPPPVQPTPTAPTIHRSPRPAQREKDEDEALARFDSLGVMDSPSASIH